MHRKKLEINLEDLLQEIYVENQMRAQLKVDTLAKHMAKDNLVQTKESKGK